MRKKLVLILFLGLFPGLLSFSQERIISYHSHIVVEDGGDLLVREDITVQAEGVDIRRGIYREFPTRYRDRMGTRFNVGFEVAEVLKNGSPEPWHSKDDRNGVVVYIGDSNTFLDRGVYTYSLTYRTTRQIGFFDDFDELYFNAIGGGWSFDIEEAVVTVVVPSGVKILQSAAYSGPEGATGCDCEISVEGNTATITTTRGLRPHEQLTLAVAWPKGFVDEPSSPQKWMAFFRGNLNVLLALLGLGSIGGYYYSRWKRYGVDPPKGTIIPLFDPPEGFSPADTALLHRMGVSQRVFTAAIVSMAVKGHLKIIQHKRKYSLERLAADTGSLTPEEKALSEALFSRGDTIDLDNKHHATFLGARNSANKILKQRMKPRYFSYNTGRLKKGFLLSVGLVVLTFIVSPSPVVPIILALLLIALAVAFSYLIMAPTVEGRALMDEIEGLKMYLSVAERDQVASMNLSREPEVTAERYEEFLPYAIALGVESQWTKKFESALSLSMQEAKDYRPAWYAGSSRAAFSPQRFSSDIGRGLSTAISSAASPPGSSSGSGGGGSSGGGGGGGGGGGW